MIENAAPKNARTHTNTVFPQFTASGIVCFFSTVMIKSVSPRFSISREGYSCWITAITSSTLNT